MFPSLAGIPSSQLTISQYKTPKLTSLQSSFTSFFTVFRWMYDEKFNINNFGFSYHKKENEGPQSTRTVYWPVWIYLSSFECLLEYVKRNKMYLPCYMYNKNFYNCIYAFDVFSPQDDQLCVWQWILNLLPVEIFGYKCNTNCLTNRKRVKQY